MKNLRTIQHIGAIGALLAGLSHITLQAFSHISLIPHALFFLTFGGAQIVWAYQFFRNPHRSHLNHYIGIAINGGFLGLWALTRFLPAPFIGEAEVIDFIGLVVALCEVFALWAIVTSQTKDEIFRESIIALSLMVLITFGVSSSIYTSGLIGEKIFPMWKMSGHHGGGGGHHDMMKGMMKDKGHQDMMQGMMKNMHSGHGDSAEMSGSGLCPTDCSGSEGCSKGDGHNH